MPRPLRLLHTTIGKKAALAVSGLVLFGFVIVHMLGNLQVFLGPAAFNAYAASLKGMPGLVWATRMVLLVAVVVHVVTMIQLYTRSRWARPEGYRQERLRAATYASSTMHFTGPMVFLYIVFHIAHFTAPGLAFGDYEFSATDVYSNFVHGFSIPWVTAVYCMANLLLGLHLYHGAWSLLQSVGLSHPRYDHSRAVVARSIAVALTLGNVAMPLAVLAGFLSR